MVTSSARPVITVLCPTVDDQPPHLGPVEDRAQVRYVDAQGLADAIADADVLFLWDFFSGAVQDAWPRATRLRWVHVAAAGVDRLLFDELVDSDVVVTNARGVFDRPIAEFVLAVILAQAKALPTSYRLQLERSWQHRESTTIDASRALVVGTGSIGRETARLLKAVGMDVRGVGRRPRSGDPDFGEVSASDDLADHVGWADHVVIAAPLTEQTRGLVNEKVLAAMRPTSHLVNVGRGQIVDEPALVSALERGELAAASLDVFATEPLPQDSPLWATPNVVVTPHMSGDARGWLDTLALQFVDNALRWLDGRPLINVVDKQLGFVPGEPPAAEEPS